jgi:hypothetical protein
MAQEFQYLGAGGTIIRLYGVNDNPPYRLAVDIGDGVNVALAESELFIGRVGADVVEVTVTPTITAGAYTAGDALGGRLDFAGVIRAAGARASVITKVVITDDAAQLAPIDIVFFNTIFTATADNAPFDPTDADLANCIGYVDIAATDYANFNDNAVAAKSSGLRMPFPFVLAPGDTTLTAQMVVRAAPTYVATDDLTVKITVERL